MFSGLQSRVAVGFGGLSLGLRLCLEVRGALTSDETTGAKPLKSKEPKEAWL